MPRVSTFIALAAAGITLVFLLRQHGESSLTPGSASYTNQEVGFTVVFPQSWSTHETPNMPGQAGGLLGVDPVLVVTELPHGTTTEFNSNIVVSTRQVSGTPSSRDPMAFVDLAAEMLGSVIVPTGSDIPPTQTFSRNGLAGAQSVVGYIQESQRGRRRLSAKVAVLISPTHQRCFLITATAPTEVFDQYHPIFQSFIWSFRET